MSKMNISLPDSLKAFVDEQVSQRGYGSSSEYVGELICRDLERQQLRNLRNSWLTYFEGLRPNAPDRQARHKDIRIAEADGPCII